VLSNLFGKQFKIAQWDVMPFHNFQLMLTLTLLSASIYDSPQPSESDSI